MPKLIIKLPLIITLTKTLNIYSTLFLYYFSYSRSGLCTQIVAIKDCLMICFCCCSQSLTGNYHLPLPKTSGSRTLSPSCIWPIYRSLTLFPIIIDLTLWIFSHPTLTLLYLFPQSTPMTTIFWTSCILSPEVTGQTFSLLEDFNIIRVGFAPFFHLNKMEGWFN